MSSQDPYAEFQQDPYAEFQKPPEKPSQPTVPSETWSHWVLRKGIDLLPAIGATAGAAVAGGPVGAALGAGAGASIRQVVEPSSTVTEAATDIGGQAALGAATEAIPLGAMADWMKRTAPLSYAKIFGKVGEELPPQAAKTAETLLKKRKMFASRGTMTRQAGKQVERLGAKIGPMEAAAAGEQYELQPVLDALEQIEQRLLTEPTATAVSGETAQIALYQARPSIRAVRDIRNQLTGPEGAVTSISRASLLKVKRRIAEVAFSGGRFDERGIELLRGVERDMEEALRTALHEPRPDIAKIDQEFALWKSIRELAEPKKPASGRTFTPWEQRTVAKAGLAVAAGEGAFRVTGSGGEALGAVMAVYAIDRAINSGAWHTVSGVVKNELAGALAREDFQTVIRLLTRAGLAQLPNVVQTPGEARERARQLFQQSIP